MDEQQYQYFLQRYANMSDEELSYLIVSRSGSLAEEAEHALRTVLAGRNSDSFNQELAATANDQEAQFRHDEALAVVSQHIVPVESKASDGRAMLGGRVWPMEVVVVHPGLQFPCSMV